MLKFKFLLLLATLWAATAQARSLLEHPHFEMERGRKLYVEMRRGQDPLKPTLLFLPGLFCAPRLDEKFIEILKSSGYGVVIMNFSLQAPSIDLLDKGEIPYFKTRNMSLQDLANEIEFVARMIRAEFPEINLIPVSLSYSSIVTPSLTGFDHIIETSPMTSTWSAIPEIRDLRNFLSFNPFLSREAVRRTLNQTYFNTSYSITEFAIRMYKLASGRRFEMNEGYEALMRMAEDFDWLETTFNPQVRRDWIVARGEKYSLKAHQKELIAKYTQAQPHSRAIEIPFSGHVIKDSQPEKLAQALIQLTGGCEVHVTL